MLMPCVRSGTEQDAQSLLLRPDAPFHIFPVKRVVTSAIASIFAQRASAKQPGARARAQMPANLIFAAGIRVEYLNPRSVDIPVCETRFLAPAGRALLVDLASDRKNLRGTQRANRLQRRPVQRHVVVHQERPVVPNVAKPL